MTEPFQLLLSGATVTIVLTLITSVLSLLLGILIGTFRLSQRRLLRLIGTAHVEVHRNVPALVLIIFWAFAVPNLFPVAMRQRIFFDNPIVDTAAAWTGLPLIYYVIAAIVALTLNTSAYIAELFRAGVGTIAQEHADAARSLGASVTDLFFRIYLPQGLRAAFPAISTRLIHNMKNTALAAFVSVPELFHGMQTAITRTFQAVEFLLITAAIYLALSLLFSALLRWLEQLLTQSETQGAHSRVSMPTAWVAND